MWGCSFNNTETLFLCVFWLHASIHHPGSLNVRLPFIHTRKRKWTIMADGKQSVAEGRWSGWATAKWNTLAQGGGGGDWKRTHVVNRFVQISNLQYHLCVVWLYVVRSRIREVYMLWSQTHSGRTAAWRTRYVEGMCSVCFSVCLCVCLSFLFSASHSPLCLFPPAVLHPPPLLFFLCRPYRSAYSKCPTAVLKDKL